jgi:hypothetical protein
MVGHVLSTGPILPSPNVPPYPQRWVSHLSKLFLISRRRLSRPFHLLHPLSPTPPASSPDPPSSISQKRGCVEDTLEFAEGPIHAHVPVHGTRKRRLSQCVSPAPSKRQRRPSISHEGNSVTNPTPSFDGYQDLCQGRPPDPVEFLQPTLQVPLDSNIPLDLGVFDWNWISDPLVGSAPSICT